MENKKELREIQDVRELANVPIGEIVICEGKKIEVREWDTDTGCNGCCLDTDDTSICALVGCTERKRPDGKSVSYVVISQ